MTTPHLPAATRGLPGAVDVLVVGAGLSGVCVGHDLLAAGIDSFCIVEEADGPGGTWRYNVYPGAACDIPSHLYCFSFAPNAEWSRVYSPQPEILAYVERCVRDFGLEPRLHFGRTVRSHVFDPRQRRWLTSFEDGSSVTSRFVVRAAGGLHKPSWPGIAGLESFGGTLMHSARWDRSVDMRGRAVAVIGTAASGIQIVPEAAKVARSLAVFQRTPNYIFPRGDRAYTEDERTQFREDEQALAAIRSQQFWRCELEVHPVVGGDPTVQAAAKAVHRAHLDNQVANPELRAKLIPDYPVGCKRMLSSDDFYPALTLEHVELVTEPIRAVDASGITTADGRHREVDVIVCATGFDLIGHGLSTEVIGVDGVSIAEVWNGIPAAHRGVMVPGFPNLFSVMGPNTGTGTFSAVHIIESDSGYIVRCIQLAGKDGLIEPTLEAFTEYNERLQERLGVTVWAGSCDSWYKIGRHITALYPGNGSEYAADKAEVRLSEVALRQADLVSPRR